jgi:protein-disulfide isomerase
MKSKLLLVGLVAAISCNVPSAGPGNRGKDRPAPVDVAPKTPGAVAEPKPIFDLDEFFKDARSIEVPGPNGPNDSEGLPIANSPVKGNDKALVTIFEFSDLQCPYCQKGDETIRQVVDKYGEQVRIVWKNFPLVDIHPNAIPSAIALMALQRQGEGVFWGASNALFDSLPTWGGRGAPQLLPAQFETYISQVPGINLEQWRSDIQDKNINNAIIADMKLSSFVGVEATPTFFINGRKISGAYPIDEISRIIDAEISAVKQELAQGTAPEKVFSLRMKANLVTADTRFQVEAIGPGYGSSEPKVTIVSFSEFQCPACVQGDAQLREAMKAFMNDAKVVYRNLPLTEIHPDAFLAGEAALAANEQGKYNEYHQKLFQNQRLPDPSNPRGKSGLTRNYLEQYAQELGLNMDQFKAALDSGKYKEVVDRDMAAAAALGVSGTPAYYINGKFFSGAYPAEAFTEIITAEMKLADEMLAKGTPRAGLYQEMMKTAKPPQP